MKPKPRYRFYAKLLLTSAFLLSGSLSLAQLALAEGTPAGTTINNTATGSFEGNTSNTPGTVTSNTVTLSVQEIAGITVAFLGNSEPIKTLLATEFSTVTPGPYQGIEGINNGDIVYFDFTVTNTGNSPTAFYIPNTATVPVTGGTFQSIAVTAVDPDGAAGANPATTFTVPKAVPSVEADKITTSTNFLGATNGYIPIGGTVTVRVAVKVTGVAVGDITKVVLGGQNTAGTSVNSGEDFVANGSLDLYTSDLANGTLVPNSGYTADAGYRNVAGIDQTLETNGNPVNGDTTFFRREASAEATTTITAGTDYGDAPDPLFKTLLAVTGSGSTASYASSGASQIIDAANIKMGATAPDAEATGQPVTSPASANSPSGDGTDEDGVTLPALTTSTTTYTAKVNVTNTTGAPAYLVGWIDFNGNGSFDDGERVVYDANTATTEIDPIATGTSNSNVDLTWTGSVLNGITSGVKYARFRLTTDVNVLGTSTAVGSAAGKITATSVTNNPNTPLGKGEVEDYSINVGGAVNTSPNITLVKRITAINGVPINMFVADAGTADPKWPDSDADPNNTVNVYLRGAIACPTVGFCTAPQPNDTIEYTIYFLSNGTANATNVTICDLIPSNSTFFSGAYNIVGSGTNLDIAFLNSTSLPIPTTPSAYLTGISDSDRGNFFQPNTLPPTTCKNPANNSTLSATDNTNGLVVVDVAKRITAFPSPPTESIPFATSAGTPANSYGFVRFTVKVN